MNWLSLTCTSAIQLQPTIELYLIRGKLQESLGKLEDAAAGYQDGLAKLGDAILLKKNLIRVQIAQKQYGEALALIDEEVARSSVKTPWHLQRAEILDKMGQPDAARLAYEQALSEANRVLGKRPTAMQLLARAEVYHAMGRMEEAKQDLRVAIQKTPHFAEADDLLKKIREPINLSPTGAPARMKENMESLKRSRGGAWWRWAVCCSVLVASVAPAAAAVVRQPYLQLVTPSSITVVWRTDLNSADNSQVKYGTVSGSLTQTATGTAVTRSGLNVKDHIVTDYGPDCCH